MFLIDDTKDADATNTHGQSSQSTKPAVASQSSDAFQKSIDYLKSAKDKAQAYTMIEESTAVLSLRNN